jgi:polar amino acid transport system substrate-binding protein
VAVSYEDDVHPYSDLLSGRLDAVLLDNVLAERRARTTPGSSRTRAVARLHYVGVLAPANDALRDRVNEILKQGDARTAVSKRFSASGKSGTTISPRCSTVCSAVNPFRRSSDTKPTVSPTLSKWEATKRYLPSLLRASGVTLLLSCASMLLAVALGVALPRGASTEIVSRAGFSPATSS